MKMASQVRQDIEKVVARINTVLGTPAEPYRLGATTNERDERYIANVGNYHIDNNGTGLSLCQMCEGGGTTTIIHRQGAKEMLDSLHIFLAGIAAGRGKQ